jgi:hypothetical protein
MPPEKTANAGMPAVRVCLGEAGAPGGMIRSLSPAPGVVVTSAMKAGHEAVPSPAPAQYVSPSSNASLASGRAPFRSWTSP